MGRYGDIDYPTVTKRAFVLGVALFLVGVLGESIGRAYFRGLQPWEDALLVDAEVLGILTALLSPLVFGVILPLTE